MLKVPLNTNGFYVKHEAAAVDLQMKVSSCAVLLIPQFMDENLPRPGRRRHGAQGSSRIGRSVRGRSEQMHSCMTCVHSCPGAPFANKDHEPGAMPNAWDAESALRMPSRAIQLSILKQTV
jgi:hypothetical protein